MTENNVKLEEQELENIKVIKNRSNILVQELGSIALADINLKKRKAAAEKFLEETNQMEIQVANALQEKYGKGNIDLAEGTFTPVE